MSESVRKIGALIKKDGKLELKTEGFQGETCLEEADKLIAKLKELGVHVETQDLDKTQEFYVTDEAKVQIQ